jgi:hypothetical protein
VRCQSTEIHGHPPFTCVIRIAQPGLVGELPCLNRQRRS